MLRIGIVGCGNIGHIVASHRQGFEIVAAFDNDAQQLARYCTTFGITECASIGALLNQPFDILLEAASIQAVHDCCEATLRANRDVVILSVGALADKSFKRAVVEQARERGRRIHIPTGALFGLDNAQVGQLSGIETVHLITTKSPAALGINVTKKTRLFSGPAEECIQLYPKNVNVSVALQLATDKPVTVELWADPDASTNTHQVDMAGKFGRVSIMVANLPSPDNPSTSYLAALSVLTLLKNLQEPLVIGA